MGRPLSRLLHRSWYSHVQILSDLHLEIGQQYGAFTFPAAAPYLLLAGDIGRLVDYDGYLRFLAAQAARFEVVLLVLGNHEFYGLSRADGLAAARRLVAEPSLQRIVVLLDRARWDSPRSRLSVLGCTLWSAIAEDRVELVRAAVSDFRHIDGWTTAAHDEEHARDAAWLREQVAGLAADAQRRKVLVATHHAPCVEGASPPEHAGSPLSSAFATELLAEGHWAPTVSTWVFGHTHHCAEMVRAGVRVVANQRGHVFPGTKSGAVKAAKWKRARGFDPAKVVVVQ